MNLFARIAPGSPAYKTWRQHKRPGGSLQGVLFKWDGNAFVSGEIDEDQAAALRTVRGVILEGLSSLPPEDPAPEPVAESIDPPPATERRSVIPPPSRTPKFAPPPPRR